MTLKRGGGARRRRFLPGGCAQFPNLIHPVSARKLKLLEIRKKQNKIPAGIFVARSAAIRPRVCALTSWAGDCSKLTEVIQTDASFAVSLVQSVASTSCSSELSFGARGVLHRPHFEPLRSAVWLITREANCCRSAMHRVQSNTHRPSTSITGC